MNAEQLRQEQAAREQAAQNQNQPMMIQDGSETGAPTAPAAIVNPVPNPFAPFAGVPGLGGTATTESIHNVMNSIRFQQSNVILPPTDSSQTAIGDIAASVANLSQSVTLFGAAQQAANAELRQFGHDTLESTHQTLHRVVEINAQSAQTTARKALARPHRRARIRPSKRDGPHRSTCSRSRGIGPSTHCYPRKDD